MEMSELLPEAWMSDGTESEQENKYMYPALMLKRRRPPVKNAFVWAQCYAALAGVLSTRYPTYVPGLMAYQAIILKAYRDFDGLGWAQYDRGSVRSGLP